jgi:hypothetical protein
MSRKSDADSIIENMDRQVMSILAKDLAGVTEEE